MRAKIDNVLEKLVLSILVLMLVSVVWQVFSRFVLSTPSTITDEISSFSLIWVGLLGAAYATGKNLHLAIDLIPENVVQKRQASMQDFNKLMRSATQILKDGETQGLEDIYTKIESIMIEYPNLFPNDSFEGKTKASQNIIEDRDAFNIIAQDTSELAALAKIAASNNDLEALQQHHQNLFGSCKSCHSRFKN